MSAVWVVRDVDGDQIDVALNHSDAMDRSIDAGDTITRETLLTPEARDDAERWAFYRRMMFIKPSRLAVALGPCVDGEMLDAAIDALRAQEGV